MSEHGIEVTIRSALESDLEDIRLCARRAYSKYIERMGKEPSPMHADFATRIATGCVDIAMCDGNFSGYVVFFYEGDHTLLESVAILPEYSGCGVGKRLIEHVERSTSQAGYQAVELYTNEAMTENLAMYPRLGYVEISRRSEAGFKRVFFRKQVQD